MLRLNRILTKALEPATREALLKGLGLQRLIFEHMRLDSLETALHLAKWVRSYLKWLPEVPKCPRCENPMEQGLYMKKEARTFKPNPTSWTGYDTVPADLDSGCAKVERYACMNCFEVQYVGRENDVRILMHTRRGRCGEHAILYTSFLLALGIRARLIAAVVNADHVWTEVYVGDDWVPVDVSAEDPERLIKDPYLFERWEWKLDKVYALEPGNLPVLVGSYRFPEASGELLKAIERGRRL